MKQYRDVMKQIKEQGIQSEARTDMDRIRIFAPEMRFDLAEGIPLVTGKKTEFTSLLKEWIWFLSGNTNINDLGCGIWDAWALKRDVYKKERLTPHQRAVLFAKAKGIEFSSASKLLTAADRSPNLHESSETLLRDAGIDTHRDVPFMDEGELGPVYGRMWTAWPNPDGTTTNQIAYVEDLLRNNPTSSRMLFHGWNPSFLPDESKTHEENVLAGKQVLPPCHLVYTFAVIDGKLNLHMLMRSNDFWLGAPFNIAQASLWVYAWAKIMGMEVGELVVTPVDCHLYTNQMPLVDEFLSRPEHPLPKLKIHGDHKSIFDIKYEDIELIDYKYEPAMRVPVAV